MISLYKRVVDFCTPKRVAKTTDHNIAIIEQGGAVPDGAAVASVVGHRGVVPDCRLYGAIDHGLCRQGGAVQG